MTTGTTKVSFGMFSSTAAAIALSLGIFQSAQIPSRTYELPLADDRRSWEEYVNNPYYSIRKTDIENLRRVEILHRFASEVLENTMTLDAEVAKIINKNFPKLV